MHHTYTVEGVFETTQITSQLQTDANIISWNIALLFAPLLSKHYLLVCLLSMSTVFSSGHGNEEDWLSRTSRKCCEDNRMCPGSAAEGRRIQGSYCTLWNGLRNAKCLPFFFLLGLGRITCWRRQALKIMWPLCDTCVWHCTGTRMFVVTHLHILLRQPEGFTGEIKPPSAVIQAMDTDVWSRQQGRRKTCHLKIYMTNVDFMTSLEGGYQQEQW